MTKIAKQRGADIRIVGSRLQIANLLAAFSARGFTWDSNEHFYPRIGQPDFFSYYLDDLKSDEAYSPLKLQQPRCSTQP